jgi:fused signal recognition particle receptor
MAKKGFFSWFKKDSNKSEQIDTVQVESKQEQIEVIAEKSLKTEDVSKSISTDNSVQVQAELKHETQNDTVVDKEVPSDDVLIDSIKDNKLSESSVLDKSEKNDETNVKDDESDVDTVTSTEDLIPEPQNKPGFFKRLFKGLKRTRENIGFGFVALFKGRKIDDDLFEELETALITADIGIETTQKIMAKLTSEASLRELKDSDSLMNRLTKELHGVLDQVSVPLEIKKGNKPFVILMVGVNGVGKTTTIGKLAKLYESKGLKVMLAAGDTFRAAAVEQLKVWGQRNNIPVVAQSTGSDSASVIFDAFNSAMAKGYDVLIADTAGRLQNKANLMEELRKIVRVMKKLDATAPHEVMLTVDAGTGQNAISQAKLFGEVVPLTGINLTKLDGTAKGGVIFNIADQFHVPIRYIGVGEGIDDLREFNADDFIKALFSAEEK